MFPYSAHVVTELFQESENNVNHVLWLGLGIELCTFLVTTELRRTTESQIFDTCRECIWVRERKREIKSTPPRSQMWLDQ